MDVPQLSTTAAACCPYARISFVHHAQQKYKYIKKETK